MTRTARTTERALLAKARADCDLIVTLCNSGKAKQAAVLAYELGHEIDAATAQTEQQPHETVYGIIDPDYARIYTIARLLAWSEGYAIALHGSFTRDLDLLAVPWTDVACEPAHLVRRLLSSTDLLRAIHRDDSEPGPPSEKPHGRLVWTLVFKKFGDPRFVDLSVLPAVAAPTAAAQPEAKL